MSILNFPSNPENGDFYNGYVYNETKGTWNIATQTKSFFFVGETQPENPGQGDIWFDSTVGQVYMHYVDEDGDQWVQFGIGRQGIQGPQGLQGIQGPPGVDGGDVYAPKFFVENVQTGSYTLQLSDINKIVAVNNSSSVTVTVPSNSTAAFPLGTVINIYAMTNNNVVIGSEVGVTVRNSGIISTQYTEISLRKRDTNEWVLSGNVI